MKNTNGHNLRANIYLLGVTSFLNDCSSEIIMPILPLLIVSLGGSAVTIGLVAGFRDAIASLLNVICGYWADRISKKKASLQLVI